MQLLLRVSQQLLNRCFCDTITLKKVIVKRLVELNNRGKFVFTIKLFHKVLAGKNVPALTRRKVASQKSKTNYGYLRRLLVLVKL